MLEGQGTLHMRKRCVLTIMGIEMPALRADALPSEPPGKSTEKLHGKPSLSLCFQLLPHLVM